MCPKMSYWLPLICLIYPEKFSRYHNLSSRYPKMTSRQTLASSSEFGIFHFEKGIKVELRNQSENHYLILNLRLNSPKNAYFKQFVFDLSIFFFFEILQNVFQLPKNVFQVPDKIIKIAES
jgi:hypothetical protein